MNMYMEKTSIIFNNFFHWIYTRNNQKYHILTPMNQLFKCRSDVVYRSNNERWMELCCFQDRLLNHARRTVFLYRAISFRYVHTARIVWRVCLWRKRIDLFIYERLPGIDQRINVTLYFSDRRIRSKKQTLIHNMLVWFWDLLINSLIIFTSGYKSLEVVY